MAKLTQAQKIVWAIDPFEEQNESRPHVASFVRKLIIGGAEVEPVYVLSPDEYDLNIQFNAPWLKTLRPSAEKVLEHYVRELKIAGLQPPQIVIEKKPSMSQGVRTLVNYAKRSGAGIILVGTHARSGFPRLFLGSFAETLLLHSSLPVMVVGPHAETPRIDRILFATDLGKRAHLVFKHVIALAKAHQAKITLFHAVAHPFEPALQSGVYLLGGGFIPIPDFVTREEEGKKNIADRYVALAKKNGVGIETRLESAHGGVVEAILECAKKTDSQLIAMAAESGTLASGLIGSVTRQVVRNAPCPIWVIRAS